MSILLKNTSQMIDACDLCMQKLKINCPSILDLGPFEMATFAAAIFMFVVLLLNIRTLRKIKKEKKLQEQNNETQKNKP